jgi:hypothetical protein
LSGTSSQGEVWIGAIHVRKLDGCKVLKDEAGAFTNVISCAASEEEFRRKLDFLADKRRLFIVGIRLIMLASQWRQKYASDTELEELIAAAEQNSNEILYSTFYAYRRDSA